MYGRVETFLRACLPGETVPLQLLHGHAALTEEFVSRLTPAGVDAGEEDAQGAVVAGEWFTYRKRGLLAPFGVGTVDQVLLAALQTRHVFVRLFGLAHKIVIVDEVHAYDTYMSALLERLLEWLAALGTPAVLLSATLPRDRCLGLLAAYARGLGRGDVGSVRLAAHPRVSWIDTAANGSESVPTTPSSRRAIAVDWIDRDPSAAAEPSPLGPTLQEALKDGGCAAVICNTVDRAQQVYRALQPQFGGHASDSGPVLDLLHARFPHGARMERERRTLARFGPPDAPAVHRPHRAVLVATQIVEQSLDLDFDVMVTDPAPVDLLLQRAGRLQRHARKGRPVGPPVLRICAPALRHEGAPRFDSGDSAVYDEHILLRTWLAIRAQGSTIRVPEDVETLIEAVYDGRPCPAGIEPAITTAWEETAERLRAATGSEQEKALERRIPRPDDEGELAAITRSRLEEDAPDLHEAFQALTRLGQPSLPVVCLRGTPARPILPDRTAVDLDQRPGLPAARRLLDFSVPVSHRGVVAALRDVPVPAGWERSPLLRRHRALVFDATERCYLGPWTLSLDPETGLEIKRQDG